MCFVLCPALCWNNVLGYAHWDVISVFNLSNMSFNHLVSWHAADNQMAFKTPEAVDTQHVAARMSSNQPA